jgi:pimeloyl-ACP methyl ester carboxylesterase
MFDRPLEFEETESGRIAYRRYGSGGGVPLVLATRFRGTIDDWDPAFIDRISANREVIVFDNAGVNFSEGIVPSTVAAMASDALGFLDALSLEAADLLGWSMGGCVVQEMALQRPTVIRRLIVAGSGPGMPAGTPPTPGLASEVAAKPVNDDEDFLYMFYPETEHARSAGMESLHRIGAAQLEESPGISPQAIGAQGTALAAWSRGENTWDRLADLQLPVLVASGAHDILMHPFGAYSMSQRLPHGKVVIYSDAGHAFLFQHIEDFSREVDDFLA